MEAEFLVRALAGDLDFLADALEQAYNLRQSYDIYNSIVEVFADHPMALLTAAGDIIAAHNLNGGHLNQPHRIIELLGARISVF